MTINEFLQSRANGIHFNTLLLMTEPHAAYPGKLPSPRVSILRHLQRLDAETRDMLDK